MPANRNITHAGQHGFFKIYRSQLGLILIDIGPNLGAINRSVLIATDYVVIPLGADLFSLQEIKKPWTKLEKHVEKTSG